MQNQQMTKTKIVATLGPASALPDTISQLIDSGVDLFRLNFSHGTLDEHDRLLSTVDAITT